MAKFHVLQAITTKYLGPTDRRGSRIRASSQAGSKTVSYDDSLNSDSAHAAAAQALAEKLQWSGAWYAGGMPDGRGNVFVCVPDGSVDGAAFVVAKVRP